MHHCSVEVRRCLVQTIKMQGASSSHGRSMNRSKVRAYIQIFMFDPHTEGSPPGYYCSEQGEEEKRVQTLLDYTIVSCAFGRRPSSHIAGGIPLVEE